EPRRVARPDARAARRLGLQLGRRLVIAAAEAGIADRDRSRARAQREIPLVRSLRSGDAGAPGRDREAAHRALSRHTLSPGIFLRQRGRLVERRALRVLFEEAG